MNTANLQLEGLYVAVAAIISAVRDRGLLSAEDIDAALSDADRKIASDPRRTTVLSDANRDAIRFPLRFLRLANETSARGETPSFAELAAKVGRIKDEA